MAYNFFEATIENIVDENDMVKRYFIRMPDTISFGFKAGQFIMLNLPLQPKSTNRSYSIASAPSNDNICELCISMHKGGIASTYIFENYKVGSAVMVSKALGHFNLPDPIDTDICFICTGTGIAPLRSQLLDIFNRNLPHKNLYMVFGNRFEKDILYRKEMETQEQLHPEFKFYPVLSRENSGWKGRNGYVHDCYEELFKDKHPGKFYICGWPGMLKDARQRIEAMGYDKKDIAFESFE